MLPKALAVALVIASVFPAALVLQAGIAIDLWIMRTPAPRPGLMRIYRALNLLLVIGAALFLVGAGIGMLVVVNKKLGPPSPSQGVPEGWPAAPSQ
jgi:hypothetical protein